jgi:hypothetical protein
MVGDNIPKLAVLIDADNARSSVVNQLLPKSPNMAQLMRSGHMGTGLNLIYRAGGASSLSNRSN